MNNGNVTITATPSKVARLAAALDLYICQSRAEGRDVEAAFAARDRDLLRVWLLEHHWEVAT